MNLFTCQNVSFRYDGVTVISDLNFHINKGDYLCIIGENGAGKTTLLKGILSVKKPSKGQLLWEGNEISRKVGYLPQKNIIEGDFPATVYEVVLSGRLCHLGMLPFYRRIDKKEALFQIKNLGLEELKDKCFQDLSGGQQQRTLLARALCSSKELLVLDEPIAGLDPKAAKDIYQWIEKLNREDGYTIIMVSHDMNRVLDYASHILFLNEDSTFFGTKKEYLSYTSKNVVRKGGNYDFIFS